MKPATRYPVKRFFFVFFCKLYIIMYRCIRIYYYRGIAVGNELYEQNQFSLFETRRVRRVTMMLLLYTHATSYYIYI